MKISKIMMIGVLALIPHALEAKIPTVSIHNTLSDKKNIIIEGKDLVKNASTFRTVAYNNKTIAFQGDKITVEGGSPDDFVVINCMQKGCGKSNGNLYSTCSEDGKKLKECSIGYAQ